MGPGEMARKQAKEQVSSIFETVRATHCLAGDNHKDKGSEGFPRMRALFVVVPNLCFLSC